MPPKHLRLADYDSDDSAPASPRPEKRRRLQPVARPSCASASGSTSTSASTTNRDLLTPLSDELLIRILSFLSLRHLLAVAPVSRRFHRLADDSQLWKGLYYTRFVLPRALRIPGTRQGQPGRVLEYKLYYQGNRTLWADGRRGGLVKEAARDAHPAKRLKAHPWTPQVEEDERHGAQHVQTDDKDDSAHWKRQYRIRHNWVHGKCAVEELELRPDNDTRHVGQEQDGHGPSDGSSMLVKVVEGLAVTADRTYGLRAWHLKIRQVMAQLDLAPQDAQSTTAEPHSSPPPSCIAVDDRELDRGTLDIAIGFVDGSFGVWRLSIRRRELVRRYRHAKSSNGELIAMAYHHPYLVTATKLALISLYTFDVPEQQEEEEEEDNDADETPTSENVPLKRSISPPKRSSTSYPRHTLKHGATALPAPYLVTSLKSLASNAPLALSIRRSANTTLASIASTFYTRSSWSVGIQDLLIRPHANPKCPPRVTTVLASSAPVTMPNLHVSRTTSYSSSPLLHVEPTSTDSNTSPSCPANPRGHHPSGPTSLCYSHPYLLATLPDNTLSLYLCTSTVTQLSISAGVRLFGHTSGISRAEITARGKAVSVSRRGDEVRVWELEGKPNGVRSRSVEIRPAALVEQDGSATTMTMVKQGIKKNGDVVDWDERRNWVGFDDEMVIVLKEAKGGRESLLVYDFT
ncbi:hypothetical protein BD289DRAFT_375968 [Coniella lustricola]|uniref:F-box domain-containing protein n=1 Tax=Coniella lustricola TaxID=2025994 RepID=A0A2T2ZXH3_9PEZI|nr:hypothetical protein BD289DRAFT_375968 [Coniella lustricola]